MSSRSPFAVPPRHDTNQNALRKIDEEIIQLETRLTSLHQTIPRSERFVQSIPDGIHRLGVQIRSLKSTRNTLIPVARLPHEILQEIFITLGHALLTSSISRSWREITLDTPALWCYISFKHPDLVQVALSRARDHELEFAYGFPFEELKAYQHLISVWHKTLGRIKRIHVAPYSLHVPTDGFTLHLDWITPAPCLVEIYLRRVSLPQNLFSGTCPSLRSLTLSSCKFAWSAIPVSSNLRKLSIDSPSSRVSIDDVVAKIRIVGPTLHELSLQSVLLPTPSTLSGPEMVQTRIAFERMESFKLDDKHARLVCFFLDQISLPSCPDITVEVSEGSLEEQFAVAQALVGSRGLPIWPVLDLECSWDEECLIFQLTEEWRRKSGSAMISKNTSVRLGLSTMGVDDAAAVLPAFAILPFSPMNAIRFSGGWFEDHHPGIFDYFNAQGTIQRLELAAEFVPTFIRYIQPQNSRLREIANLVGIDDRNRLLLDHQTAELGLTLREWLVWRNIFGVRLGSLVLVNLNVPCGTTDWFEG